jgi:hypothetical protein
MPAINAIFDNRNILEAHIRWGPHQAVLYTTHTEIGVFGRRITTLTTVTGQEVGAILWRDKGLRIFGVTRSFDAIKINRNSMWVRFLGCACLWRSHSRRLSDSRSRYWRGMTHTYEVTFIGDTWQVSLRGLHLRLHLTSHPSTGNVFILPIARCRLTQALRTPYRCKLCTCSPTCLQRHLSRGPDDVDFGTYLF